MNTRIAIAALAAGLIAIPAHAFATDRLTLTGKVTDADGKPLDHATVMVYHAGVKQGYSTFCPSCYSDCGKRTLTDSAGAFTIPSLSPDLYFELLIVHDGYLPAFVKKVDPAKPGPTAALNTREAVTDVHRVLRGLVVDTQQRPIRDAVVQPQGSLVNCPAAAEPPFTELFRASIQWQSQTRRANSNSHTPGLSTRWYCRSKRAAWRPRSSPRSPAVPIAIPSR